MTTAVPTRYRAVMITPQFTAVDGQRDTPERSVRLTPDDTWSQGFGRLLTRLARTFDGSGVILLDHAAARALKLPVGPADKATEGLDDARAAGWLHGTVGAWTVFFGETRPAITVGVTSWPDIDRSPLIHVASSLDSVYRLSLWHELTGVAWGGTPGVAGLKVFRANCPQYRMAKGGTGRPTFKHPAMPDDFDGYELDFDPDDWSRPHAARYSHGYDVTRMYLAAAQVCEAFSPWSLKHTGRIGFDPKKAGWWKVELGPWNDDRIPAPAGPGDPVRWVTTPRLALLAELEARGGPFQTFEVIDSWTAPGRRIMRNWADALEHTYQLARTMDEPDRFGLDEDSDAVRVAVKAAYREAWGLLNRETSAIHRPDWHYAGIAQAASNLWRRMWAVGQGEDRWPLEVKVDCVWYGSDDPDPLSAKPAGIPLTNAQGLTDALGTFKLNGTRERGKA